MIQKMVQLDNFGPPNFVMALHTIVHNFFEQFLTLASALKLIEGNVIYEWPLLKFSVPLN